MSGQFSGLKSLILDENNSAYYVYCFAHQLHGQSYDGMLREYEFVSLVSEGMLREYEFVSLVSEVMLLEYKFASPISEGMLHEYEFKSPVSDVDDFLFLIDL
ncbi:hypothetical protein QN277_008801 [Acacia crassicarpa]|uniref:Uncharacterized protein n=1 Tax=Acacia crassicarpa TaxID=499986 RepID=A0AAE1MAW0_9FABA|nr:hypothetical protein QN277_008801 [Acacia crassicarpa]